MTTLDLINEHPFLGELAPRWLDRMSVQARRANYHQGYRLFGAVAAEHTLTVRFDAPGVLRLCREDPALGYELGQRLMSIVVERLQATRVRLLDLHGVQPPEPARAPAGNGPS